MELLQRRTHALHELDAVLLGLLLGLEASDVLGLVPRAEAAVLAAQLVDDALGHGRAEERGDEGVVVDVDARRIGLVVLDFVLLLRGPGDGDVEARHHALPAPLTGHPVCDEPAVHELVDDDVPRLAGRGVGYGVDEAYGGDG